MNWVDRLLARLSPPDPKAERVDRVLAHDDRVRASFAKMDAALRVVVVRKR